ncbi:MAG: glycoside hydrolase family 9 protein [Gemmatimonadetes bacterium]|nr:glycoside hydrolase family 9 protein [Gemmatimonadota bacterium]
MRPLRASGGVALLATLLACAVASEGPAAAPADPARNGAPGAASALAGGVPAAAIRYNRLGYLPDGPKVAVLCSRDAALPDGFRVLDAAGGEVRGTAPLTQEPGLGGCRAAARLDFTGVRAPGEYTLVAGPYRAPVRIDPGAYRGVADSLLAYMRQQRSGFNPLFRDSVHHRTDAILVDHPDSGTFIPVAGGWADAADYLQYVTTSAHATFSMMAAWRDHPTAFADGHDASGLPGANGVPDVLDEARWGLEWLSKMHPRPDLILNQIGDDRDHMHLDLPTTDSSDYGWGRGGLRPVYPCTGRPQGLLEHRNRSDGKASTAGKMAAAFALGALLFGDDASPGRDTTFARILADKARTAYRVGREFPGVCQTAPARAPYFYEEANWVDDMELAASQLHALTGEPRFLREALEYAAREPVTPWMGADTARHYEWYPWHNYGHYEIWRTAGEERDVVADYYRRGLERVAARAGNGFRIGIPFIWCSNDVMVSYATQAWLYRAMTGDASFRVHEQAAVDWLFGTNPWGTSMIVGLPLDADHPTDPHSVVATELGYLTQKGGLVDGPVYGTIFENLLYVTLRDPDEYAAWNTGRIVYHDDWGDYSTNEPIMDGTAALVYVLAALSAG